MRQCVLMRAATWGLVVLAVLIPVAHAQTQPAGKQPTEKQLDAELRGLLADYYVGKPVRAKIAIPLTDAGVELHDGRIRESTPASAAVRPGELMSIKEMKFKDRSIEFVFNYAGPTEPEMHVAPPGPVGTFGADAKRAPAARAKAETHRPDPRVTVRYSHTIATTDLNLPSINRLLAPAVEVSMLGPENRLSVAEPESPNTPQKKVDPRYAGVPGAPVIGNLMGARENISEVVIECPVAGARVYIDGAYSGNLPKTLQLVAGPHLFLIVAPGYRQWEQRYLLSPSRISSVKPELIPEK